MKLNTKQINELKKLLKEQLNVDYTDEQAQRAGLAIVRFVLAKELREASEKETEANS